MTFDLPQNFTRTIQNTFQGEGQHGLESFPDLLEEASRRWVPTDIQPVSNLSYKFVTFAGLDAESIVSRCWVQSQPTLAVGPGEALQSLFVVLKLGVPNLELTSEIAALQFYNGRGACRLLDADADKRMFLLERLLPDREADCHLVRDAWYGMGTHPQLGPLPCGPVSLVEHRGQRPRLGRLQCPLCRNIHGGAKIKGQPPVPGGCPLKNKAGFTCR